jgi:hypothetical protein
MPRSRRRPRDPWSLRPSGALDRATRVLIGACVPLVGCSPPDFQSVPHPTEIAFEGEHVVAGVEDGVVVCGGAFEHVDRFVGAYLAASDGPPPTGRIRYHAITEATLRAESPCSETSAACAGFGVVYSQSPAHLHEVVHAIRQRQHADPSRGMAFFEEGIAQLHSGVPTGWRDDFAVADALEFANRYPPGGLYDRAGHVLAFIQGTGLTTAEAFVDASAGVADPVAWSALVEAQLGMDLATLERTYAAYPRCSSLAWAELPVECGAPPLAWTQDPEGAAATAVLSVGEFRCSNPAVVGPLRDRIWTSATVDVELGGLYELSREGVDESVHLVACDVGCGDDVDARVDAPNADAVVELIPGRYVIRVEASADVSGDVRVALRGPR